MRRSHYLSALPAPVILLKGDLPARPERVLLLEGDLSAHAGRVFLLGRRALPLDAAGF